MSMHKIFFGTIVFFSLAFLAACGSGGSGSSGAAGAAGAKGDAGDAGTAGTISVPSADSDLAIAASVALDSDMDFNQINRAFNVSGMDNLTADSRTRYYGYLGTSATTKTALVAAGQIDCGPSLDSRLKTTDNTTCTGAGANLSPHGYGVSPITHYIICPGNEAGDATTCASVAIGDRGPAPALAASPVGGEAELVMTYALTSGFGVLRDNNTSSTVVTQALSHTKNALTALSGSASSHVTSSKHVTISEDPSLQRFDMTSSGGSTAYFITMAGGDNDNYTLVSITSSGATANTIDNITNTADNATIGLRISEGADGIYATALLKDNQTISTFKWTSTGGAQQWAGLDNVTIFNGTQTLKNNLNHGFKPHCSSVHPSGGALAISFRADNGSLQGATATSAGWTYNATGNTNVGVIEAAYGADNDTFSCDMAFATGDGTVSGRAYLVAVGDNGTGISSYYSDDNGTSWTDIIPRNADEAAAITDISVTIDSQLKLPVFAANAGGKVNVYALDNSSGSYVWNTLLAPSAANTITTSRVSISALSDGSAFAVGYESATGDNATVQVFYDE